LKAKYEENPDGLKSDYVCFWGNQSFYAIILKQYQHAVECAYEILSIDSSLHWISTYLAAALLFQGKYAEAEAIYRQYKDELKNSFLGDLKQFAEAGVIPKEREEDVERIKKILEE
jgi:tetratricopeptide (TPR) repeat protein